MTDGDIFFFTQLCEHYCSLFTRLTSYMVAAHSVRLCTCYPVLRNLNWFELLSHSSLG